MSNHFTLAKEDISFYGCDCSSLQNMLAVLIGPKAKSSVTGELAGLGINRLVEMSAEEFMEYEGIGETSSARIVSSFGIGKFIANYSKPKGVAIRSPKDAADYFRDLELHSQEHFAVAYLNTKNVVLAKKTIFVGSLNASIVHPREVFKEALKHSAASLICAHNHPSGDPQPSREDIDVTKRLVEVGQALGIEVLDHVVIGNKSFISLKEKGFLN